MAKWLHGEEITFQKKYSPVFMIGTLDDGTYELALEGGWDNSSSVIATKDELLKVIEAIQKVIQ